MMPSHDFRPLVPHMPYQSVSTGDGPAVSKEASARLAAVKVLI